MNHSMPTYFLAAVASFALVHCGGDDSKRSNTAYGRAGAVTYGPSETESDENLTPASGMDTSTRGQALPGGPPRDTIGDAMGTDDRSRPTDAYGSEAAANASGSAAMGMGEMASDASMLSDEQIAAISDAANRAEIEQATVAKAKARDARVTSFAQMMIDHHGQAKRDQANLMSRLSMTPAESSRSQQLRVDSQNALTALNEAKGADFDKMYIDAQVDAHQKVLSALDNELIPNADNADLKKLLQGLRPRVESHLSLARDLQQALAKGPSNQGSSGYGDQGLGQ